jgi:hypothetical protein
MIKLSYSSLVNLHNGHEWINRQLGIPVPAYPFLQEGKDAHRIIQDHVSGKKKNKFLKHIEVIFPVVEERDFDERCGFEFIVTDGYTLAGYVDGLDEDNRRFLEIKTGSKGWSMAKFQDSMQRKIYALTHPDFTEAYFITGSKDPKVWEKEPPKLYTIKLTAEDRNEALKWVKDGISILESGKFTGGLDNDGFCEGCFWNMERYPELANCHFKK